MSKSHLAIALFAISGVLSIASPLLVRDQILLQPATAKAIGMGLVGVGMLLVLLAAVSLGPAFAGAVTPVTRKLVTTGLFRTVRHPTYLGFILAVAGVGITSRSAIGLGVLFVAFVPSCVFRARLEDLALKEAFEREWTEYAASTSFLVPFLW